jgi:translation initiation factor eIF-2B subunit gamma
MMTNSLDICVVTPPSSAAALSSALSTNPHLTSLAGPKPTLIAPAKLSQNANTADIFRLPEVQSAITGNFVVLPCDIICELSGGDFVGEWILRDTAFSNLAKTTNTGAGVAPLGSPGEALVVWYDTKDQHHVKSEETDFLISTPCAPSALAPTSGSLGARVQKLLYSTPTDTLKDLTESDDFKVRQSIFKTHSRVRILTTYRDSHIYFFPYWVMELIKRNPRLESLSEDVIGWWAKAVWQGGLASKLDLPDILDPPAAPIKRRGTVEDMTIDNELDLLGLSSTSVSSNLETTETEESETADRASPTDAKKPDPSLPIPSINVYTHPAQEKSALIRRVDTTAVLLSVSLRLAELPSVDEAGPNASPFAHASKIAYPEGLAEKCNVSKDNCLLAENVKLEERVSIAKSVIGANCVIGKNARLSGCLLMDGVVVEESSHLEGCILGRRSKIGKGSRLKDCEVQEGVMVVAQSKSSPLSLIFGEHILMKPANAKNEKFTVFDGLEEDDEDAERAAQEVLTPEA